MNRMFLKYACIFLGGGIGAVSRVAVSGLVARLCGESFPWGTWVANVTGSFLIGFIAYASDVDGRLALSPLARQLIMLGILGGYTTFSSFSLQTMNLVRDEQWSWAAGNVLLSVLCCLLATWLGIILAQNINQLR